MQLPRASTSALADGYCPAIVAESLASVSAVYAVACCAVVGRAGNPAAMKSEMPIAAIQGRALLIALPPPFGSYRLLIAELGQSGKVYYVSDVEKLTETGQCAIVHKRRHAYQIYPSSLTSLGSILPGIEPEGAKPQSLAPIRR
jgi:hypothetical protein